jgi:hypothetical protein
MSIPRKRGRDSYGAPCYLYQALDDEFGFTYDPCPLAEIPAVDGLTTNWDGRVLRSTLESN